jgi:recombination protein RecA
MAGTVVFSINTDNDRRLMDDVEKLKAEANKIYGDRTLMYFGENNTVKVDVIPTGIGVIDEILGIGGVPMGRITEIFGREATGKTSLCFHLISQAQKRGFQAAFIDMEHAISPERLKAIGVDTGKMLFSQPQSGEEALELVMMMVESGTVNLICVDSVAALIPLVEKEKEMGESVMGVHARLMSQAMRKLAAPVNRYGVALVFTNQVRAKFGLQFPTDETTGGSALKFYASLRLKMQYVGAVQNSQKQRIAGKYKVTVMKNKLATPFKEVVVEINQFGLDETGNFIDLLVSKKILETSNTYYKYQGKTLANGRGNVMRVLRENPALKQELMEALHKVEKST